MKIWAALSLSYFLLTLGRSVSCVTTKADIYKSKSIMQMKNVDKYTACSNIRSLNNKLPSYMRKQLTYRLFISNSLGIAYHYF